MASAPIHPRLQRALWWLAAAFVLGAFVVAMSIFLLNGDGMDHLNSARWFWRGDRWTRFIDHRPPVLTLLLVPVAFAYEVLRVDADTILNVCRSVSVVALALASACSARALPGWCRGVRPAAALLVASCPLLVALAPTFSQDVCAAGGMACVFMLQRRLHQAPSAQRWVALGVAIGVASLLRFDTGIVLVGVVCGELLSGAPRGRTLKIAAVAGAAGTFLFFLQYGLRFGGELVSGLSATFLDAADAVTGRPEGQRSPLALYPASALRALGPVALAAIAWGARRALRERDPVGVAALAVLAIGAVEFAIVQNAHPRYLGQLIPAAVILAAMGLASGLEGRSRRARLALLGAALAWPVSLGAVELWAFGDPVYHRATERDMARDLRQLAGTRRQIWHLGGNYVVRPQRRAAFVEGDVSTRSHSIGIGGLNFRLRQPIYHQALKTDLWETLLPLEHGAVGLVVVPVDHRVWPLRRSQQARLLTVTRVELPLGAPQRGAPGYARLEGGRLVIVSRAVSGEFAVVARDASGARRSLGVRRVKPGETSVPLDGLSVEGLTLIGGQVGALTRY